MLCERTLCSACPARGDRVHSRSYSEQHAGALGSVCVVPSGERPAGDSLIQPISHKAFSTAVAQTSLYYVGFGKQMLKEGSRSISFPDSELNSTDLFQGSDRQWSWIYDIGNASEKNSCPKGTGSCWCPVWHHHPSTL